MSHVELCERLRGSVGEEAARLIADIVPPARDLATRHDVAAVRADVEGLRADFEGLRADFAGLRVDFEGLRADFAERLGSVESRLLGRMWAMFVPLWVGMFGLIATLIVALVLQG